MNTRSASRSMGGNLYIASRFAHNVIRKSLPGCDQYGRRQGKEGYLGDNGPASSAEMDFPCGVALGCPGQSVYRHTGNDIVRKVGGSGTITTVAANRQAGLRDNGPATNAALYFPVRRAIRQPAAICTLPIRTTTCAKVGRPARSRRSPANGAQALRHGVRRQMQRCIPVQRGVDAGGNLFVADTLIMFAQGPIREARSAGPGNARRFFRRRRRGGERKLYFPSA